MNFLDAGILGIVEGITEFLPVSSTGHLVLASRFLDLEQTPFLKSFEIAIQLGAIASVLFLYARRIRDLGVLSRVAVGCIPTGAIGILLYPVVKSYLLGNPFVVAWALLLGGAGIIFFERFPRSAAFPPGIESISHRQAAVIGLFQSIAIIPGVSRSAATIFGGLWLGVPRATIVEFSFLLAVPTMIAATFLDLSKNAGSFTVHELYLLAAGSTVSFVVACVAIRFFIGFIQTHTFEPFGVYRIILGLLLLGFAL